MQEEWREVPGFLGYRVSSLGRVQSCWEHANGHGATLSDRWRDLSTKPDYSGYVHANLWNDGRSVRRKVSRLVLELFVGPCPEGMECRHLDGDKTNNQLSNLRWGTRSENVRDKTRHGTHPAPRQLLPRTVVAIEAARIAGERPRAVAERLGLNVETVRGRWRRARAAAAPE